MTYLRDLIPPAWQPLLADCAAVEQVEQFLSNEPVYQPQGEAIFRALQMVAPEQVKVVILGQDPYPTPGVPMGMSFSVTPATPVPRSLKHIFDEYEKDLGLPRPATGDLTPWAQHGVLLLNAVLTVRPGEADSHKNSGWKKVTRHLLEALVQQQEGIVFVLWGSKAKAQLKNLDLSAHRTLESAHPSPLSYKRGFVDSQPFLKCNQLLQELGRDPVDWELPA